MKNFLCLLIIMLLMYSCINKTDKDRAIELVESKYESSGQKLNFDEAKLDSLYNIQPRAYADSIKKGNELDDTLAVLESQIEHLSQKESDSVGLISAALTKRRYQLLEITKTKPQFVGWKLSGVRIKNVKREVISFNFNKEITEIVE